jgi:NarL family two-component system response regulator LiaR
LSATISRPFLSFSRHSQERIMMMMVMGSKRILVADDSDTSRTVLTRYLSAQRNLDVCGEAVNGEEAIEKAWELKPDLVLLDVAMPRTNGIVAASVLKEMMPEVRIILFTMYTDAIARAFPRGGLAADAVISKGDGMQKLAACVQSLLA